MTMHVCIGPCRLNSAGDLGKLWSALIRLRSSSMAMNTFLALMRFILFEPNRWLVTIAAIKAPLPKAPQPSVATSSS